MKQIGSVPPYRGWVMGWVYSVCGSWLAGREVVGNQRVEDVVAAFATAYASRCFLLIPAASLSTSCIRWTGAHLPRCIGTMSYWCRRTMSRLAWWRSDCFAFVDMRRKLLSGRLRKVRSRRVGERYWLSQPVSQLLSRIIPVEMICSSQCSSLPSFWTEWWLCGWNAKGFNANQGRVRGGRFAFGVAFEGSTDLALVVGEVDLDLLLSNRFLSILENRTKIDLIC